MDAEALKLHSLVNIAFLTIFGVFFLLRMGDGIGIPIKMKFGTEACGVL